MGTQYFNFFPCPIFFLWNYDGIGPGLNEPLRDSSQFWRGNFSIVLKISFENIYQWFKNYLLYLSIISELLICTLKSWWVVFKALSPDRRKLSRLTRSTFSTFPSKLKFSDVVVLRSMIPSFCRWCLQYKWSDAATLIQTIHR